MVYDPRQRRKSQIPSVGGAAPLAPQQPAPVPAPAPAPTSPGGSGGAAPMQFNPQMVTTSAIQNPGPSRGRTPTNPGGTPTPPMQPPGTPSTPGASGVGFNPINPASDMRGANILPAPTPRLAGAQGISDQAAGRVAGFDTSSAIDKYRDQFAGPDTRSQIAKDRLAQFDLENQQGVKDLQRQIIQRAFAGGRGGMGDEQVNALRPFTDYQTRRAALAHGLAADTAEGEISDRMNVLDRSIGVAGNERIGDIGAMSELERRAQGIGDFESGVRDEYRGERDYEQVINRQAMEDAIREQQYGDVRSDTLWNQDFAEDTLAAGMNPAGVYQGAAANYGAGAAGGYGNAGDLFAQWLARQRGGG